MAKDDTRRVERRVGQYEDWIMNVALRSFVPAMGTHGSEVRHDVEA